MPRMLAVSLLAALLAGAAADAPAVHLNDIPSPRPAGWSVDLTGRIPTETLRQIDHLGDAVKAESGGEMAVVVVPSARDVNTRGFATRLFNRWGIGRKGVNDGVLIFVALDDRKAEIVLGSGIDDPARRQTSEEILQGEMVPRFRDGDPAGAVLAGAQACARRILNVPLAAATQGAAQPLAQPQSAPEVLPAQPQRDKDFDFTPLIIWLLVLVIIVAVLRLLVGDSASRHVSSSLEEQMGSRNAVLLSSDSHSSSSSSDSGFGGGHSDGGGASGHW